MVLVYGAAGLLGQAICRRLRQEGKRVRALFALPASAASLESLKPLGVETFFADLSECAAVAAACKGADAVICADSAMMPSRSEPPLMPRPPSGPSRSNSRLTSIPGRRSAICKRRVQATPPQAPASRTRMRTDHSRPGETLCLSPFRDDGHTPGLWPLLPAS